MIEVVPVGQRDRVAISPTLRVFALVGIHKLKRLDQLGCDGQLVTQLAPLSHHRSDEHRGSVLSEGPQSATLIIQRIAVSGEPCFPHDPRVRFTNVSSTHDQPLLLLNGVMYFFSASRTRLRDPSLSLRYIQSRASFSMQTTILP